MIEDIVRTLAKWDCPTLVYWDTELRFWVRCRNVFDDGTHKVELTAENLAQFDAACSDMEAEVGKTCATKWGPILFCRRIKGAKPKADFMQFYPKDLREMFE